MKISFSIIIIVTLLLSFTNLIQDSTPSHKLNDLILKNDFKEAQILFDHQWREFEKTNKIDSLIQYLQHYAYIQQGLKEGNDIEFKLSSFYNHHENALTHKQKIDFYDVAGTIHYRTTKKLDKSLTYFRQGLLLTEELNPKNRIREADFHHFIGSVLTAKNNHEEARKHIKLALHTREQHKEDDVKKYLVNLNALGNSMYFTTQLDSARYFYQKAYDEAIQYEDDPYVALKLSSQNISNIAGIHYVLGEYAEGLGLMYEVADKLKRYKSVAKSVIEQNSSNKLLMQCISNIAYLNESLGKHSKAISAYEFIIKELESDPMHDKVLFTDIQNSLGTCYVHVNEFEKAIELKEKVIQKEEENAQVSLALADANYSLALIYEKLDKPEKANLYYTTTYNLFETILDGDYDYNYIDFIRNYTHFLAKNAQVEKALELASISQKYLEEKQHGENLFYAKQENNLAVICNIGKRYNQAKKHAQSSLNKYESKLKNAKSLIDTIAIEYNQTDAIANLNYANLHLDAYQNLDSLHSISNNIHHAFEILERRQLAFDSAEDLAFMYSTAQNIFKIGEIVELKLYNNTKNPKHLDNLLKIRESKTYNKIRSHLNQADSISFYGVPQDILKHERELKYQLSNYQSYITDSTKTINDYKALEFEWQTYLKDLKTNHRNYYQLRYSNLLKSIENINQSIREDESLVRYMFIEDELYALIMDKNSKNLVQLEIENLNQQIIELQSSNDIPYQVSYNLYRSIFQPVEEHINFKNLRIIPDGVLFNLSFETLLTQPSTNSSEMIENSLLNKYVILYDYTLLKGNQKPSIDFKRTYAGFSPGFFEDLKSDYSQNIHNEFSKDDYYLKLLPQPNSVEVIKDFDKKFKGKSFLKEKSTITNFKEYASGNSILHLATHADFDNQNPQGSKLIFAKEAPNYTESNYLFLNDIYTYNFQNDLTILGACETGKPGFEDGEGMVSFTHALNYAGTPNIITNLWKVDESSTSEITSHLLNNIKNEQPIAEALRNAKLQYLKENPEKLRHPKYWSAMIFMGDNHNIEIPSNQTWIYWLLGLLVVAFISLFMIKKFKT